MSSKGITDKLVQVGLSLVGIIVGFIPVWIYLGVRFLFSPEGFWQEIILFGVGVWILGIAQLVLFVVLCYWLYLVWIDKP